MLAQKLNGPSRQTEPDCRQKRASKRMFHQEGNSSSNSSLLKSVVFTQSSQNLEKNNNQTITPQKKHFQPSDKANLILNSFNNKESDAKRYSKIMFPEKNTKTSLNEQRSNTQTNIRSGIKIIQRDHSTSQSNSLLDMINKGTSEKPTRQYSKEKMNESLKSWRVMGLNVSIQNLQINQINTLHEGNNIQKQKNSNRSITPQLNKGNPITGEGYNDKMKFGKKLVTNQSGDFSTNQSRIQVKENEKPTAEQEIIKEYSKLNKIQKIQRLRQYRGEAYNTTYYQPRMKF